MSQPAQNHPPARDRARDHPHTEIAQTDRPGYCEMMEMAVHELLIEKKLIGPGEIRRQMEVLDSLADVLDFHKIINTEEKRCGVEALGAEMIGKLTYYERWIVAFANILLRKQILTPTEVALKMQELEERWPAAGTDSGEAEPRT